LGVGLSRIWASHPKLAFVLHLLVTVMIGGFAAALIVSRADWPSVAVLVIGFALMSASLVFLTRSAIQDRWQPDDYSYTGQHLPSPQAAWMDARALERALWVLFTVTFLAGLVLGAQRSIVGGVLLILALPLAIVAMRAGR